MTDQTSQLATLDAETLARELDWATAANGIRTLRDLGEPAAADALALLAGQCEAYARTAERAHNRLAALEARHERIWDIVLELRQKATTRGLDPYQDPAAQALSAILTGDTGWRITYGTLVETRDDLEAAKARAVALWERTKWEAEEHAHDWEQRPDGSLALVAWDEEQWFDCGPVIQPLTAGPESGPQIPGQTEIPAPAEADEITELRARIGRAHAELRRQHLRADHTLHPDVSGPVMAALEAVETHLTDPEHRLAEPGAAP